MFFVRGNSTWQYSKVDYGNYSWQAWQESLSLEYIGGGSSENNLALIVECRFADEHVSYSCWYYPPRLRSKHLVLYKPTRQKHRKGGNIIMKYGSTLVWFCNPSCKPTVLVLFYRNLQNLLPAGIYLVFSASVLLHNLYRA